ncbi:RICIN domain-containing protein [Nonomuraea sp. NPDC050404]|uniref:RICIN domain-containing protein n=1 Tax=Nonomuraea sp. NPDC050404 TaxID=3155783 RepID=UPI0034093FEC
MIAAPAAASDEPAARAVTVRVDPSYQQPEFEGWGTSLVWFANITGGYPDEIRDRLVEMLFGEDGLRLNIARYNIGGGNAPDVRADYMKVGATMPGFWKAPAGTTREDTDWWDPGNPEHWNWDADANQRWWIDQIKDRVDRWESFSNSPPWFQTVSGYVSGGFDAGADQIRADRVDDFATYLVRVSEHLERAHGIAFDTIDPLNEPNTNYWGTTLGPDGRPTGGRQEGAHAGPQSQQEVVLALRKALDDASTEAVVSAMDETNPGIFTQNWNAYGEPARAAVDQLNVHTYGTGQRTSARDIAKGADKKLWMSEVEGSWGSGTSYTSMDSGLGIATRIVDDLRELEPKAWVFWQPIEDSIPQQAGGGNWGSIHIPFDCTAEDTLRTCPIQPNTKFHTIRNFTHHIRPGDRMVKVDDRASVAAIRPAQRTATVVRVNNDTTPNAVTLDLSLFRQVAKGATVTPIVTSADGALVQGAPVPVTGRTATITVPARSVATFVVNGVRGVADDAALVRPGHVYRLRGVQSGRSAAPAQDGTGVVIRTDDAARAEQLWTVTNLTGGNGNRERHTIVNAATGARIAVRDGAAVLEQVPPDEAEVPAAAQWIMSTTGDGTWTFVNAGTGRLLEVAGQATADGAPVAMWTPTSGANQRWTVIDETVLATEPATAFTIPGRVPELPGTVAAVRRDGVRGVLPVTWRMPPESRWRKPGTVHVTGEAVDPLGRRLRAKAVVTVDVLTSTLPSRAKTYIGGRPELPGTVTGLGEHGGRAGLPVVWDPPPGGAFDRAGTVVLTGTAQVVGGGTLAASVRVQVTEPSEANAALVEGTAVAATYTEPGYSAEGLRNGVLNEKAWSNWRSGTKNPSDTITVTLPAARDLTRVVTHFYRDGGNVSFPQSLRVEVLGPDGAWTAASGEVPVGTEGTPVADVPVTAGAGATAARVVMTARPSGYMTAGEIEVYAKAPGRSADAAAQSIQVDGIPIAGFDPDTTGYRVAVRRPDRAAVEATPRDPYAAVRIQRADGGGSVVTATVTSEDGSQQREYRIELTRR